MIYRFKLLRKWYAYVLLHNALDAWVYFWLQGYRTMTEIEISQDNIDFQFKLTH